jgi:hypothetical protein
MERAKNAALTMGVLLGGFMGGAAFTWLSAGSEARAQMAAGGAPSMVVGNLTVVDDQGRPRIKLLVTDEGPRVSLVDESGQVRAFVGRTGPAAPGKPIWWAMNLVDAKGNPRTVCALRDDGGASSMQVRDSGAIRFMAAFNDKGGGALELHDPQNRKRFIIGMPPHAGYSMSLVDENGEKVWSAP